MEHNGEDHETKTEAGPASLADFQAELDVFSGPLDLLLHLIKRDEVDVLEVNVSHITNQYLVALRAMQMFDVNVAAEFLVMAATLMDVKSRTLLPESHIEEEEEEDARDELVRQLLQYKRFKEVSAMLAQYAQVRQKRFTRKPFHRQERMEEVSAEKLLEDVSVWDLLSSYGQIVRQIELAQPAQIIYDEVPVKAYMEELLRTLTEAHGEVSFLDLFAGEQSRARVIGLFLAILELARTKQITLDQQEGSRSQFGIVLAPGEQQDRNAEADTGADAEPVS